MVLSIRNLFGKKAKTTKAWQEIEYFDEAWKERIKIMSSFIPSGAQSVMDLGCGKMWLKTYLPVTCNYYGIDYTYRGEGSEVFDFNKYEFPLLSTDVIFVSGCLEYVKDYEWFIKEVASKCKRCIISYCIVDVFSNLEERRALTWVNDLTEKEFINLFTKNNMKLIDKTKTATENYIYIYENE